MPPMSALGKARLVQTFIFGYGGASIVFAVVAPQVPVRYAIALYALLNIAAMSCVVGFLVRRHVKLVRAKRRRPFQWRRQFHRGDQDDNRQDYYLFVLGSGGHTKEMLMMMDDGSCEFRGLHRRYVVSGGDTMSVHHLEDYEQSLDKLCDLKGNEPGTFDIRHVTRARRVHQSLFTTPLTAVLSLTEIIFGVLLTPPPHLANGDNEYPRMVFSNGPANGFFVGLAIHLLKIVYLIPEDECNFVYIESWARISTLSLTAKLFHYSGIADAFAVQHKEVATKYGVDYAGPIVFNSRRETAKKK